MTARDRSSRRPRREAGRRPAACPEKRPERQADDADRRQRRDHREHQDRGGVLENPPHVARQRGFENQRRQENVDECIRAQRQLGEQPDDLADPGRKRRCSSTPAAALIVTPIIASSTTGASPSRAAIGWLSATSTSKLENTARTRTMSTKVARSAMASGRAEIGATHLTFAILSVNRADQASSAAARSDETPTNLNGPSGRRSGRAEEGRGSTKPMRSNPPFSPPRRPRFRFLSYCFLSFRGCRPSQSLRPWSGRFWKRPMFGPAVAFAGPPGPPGEPLSPGARPFAPGAPFAPVTTMTAAWGAIGPPASKAS